MQARILSKSEEKNWSDFLNSHSFSSIHQTPEWAHFQEKIPSRGKTWIIALEENGKIIAGTLLVRYKLPLGFTWLYAPRGPLMDYNSPSVQTQMNALLTEIKKIAKQEKSIFFRIDPAISQPTSFKGFKSIAHGFQPQHTIILDLTKSEEELLKDMKPKGRYNIRLAEKKGVKIRLAQNENDIDHFYELFQQTTERDKFSGHNKTYYKEMLANLGQKHAQLYLAEYENQVIAAILNTTFKDTAIYYFGASGNAHRNLMAPYLLQWTAIQNAKAQGLKHYDFLGISPPNSPSHAWAGVTEFKKKFSSSETHFEPAQEFAFNKLFYFLYLLYKKLH